MTSSAAVAPVASVPPPSLVWHHSTPRASLPTEPLLSLLAATQPDQVERILRTVFRARNEGVTAERRNAIAAELSIDELAANEGVDTKEGAFALFPASFHPGLRTLLSKLMLQNLPDWRETIMQGAVGPAKLVEFDWRVDVKSASNHLSHMAVPTVLVDMKLQPPPSSTRLIAPLESFNFELSQAALSTLLSGLEKIQTQLSTMK